MLIIKTDEETGTETKTKNSYKEWVMARSLPNKSTISFIRNNSSQEREIEKKKNKDKLNRRRNVNSPIFSCNVPHQKQQASKRQQQHKAAKLQK